MAVSTSANIVEYTGNGSTTTVYPVPFRVLDVDHILVSHRTNLEPNAEWTQLAEGQYTVTLIEGTGLAEVTTTSAWDEEEDIQIERRVPLVQEREYPVSGSFPSKSHEKALDHLCMATQQLKTDLDSCLKFKTRVGQSGDSVFPQPAAGVLGFLVEDDEEIPSIITWDQVALNLDGAAIGDTEVNALDARVTALEGSNGSIIGGGVVIRREGEDDEYISPTADTDAGRTAALHAALVIAQLDTAVLCSIRLITGNFAIADGQPLIGYNPGGNARIEFGPETALLYETPSDAGDDYVFFTGPRHVVNFGADPTGVADSLAAFQTAEYSLPPYGGGAECEASPGLGSGGGDILLRTGTRILQNGSYLVSAPFYVAAYQSLITDGGRVAIYFDENIAPATLTPAFGVRRSVQGGNAQANFTHNVIVRGIIFAALPTGNSFLYAGLLYGAQCSLFANLGLSGFAGGFIFGQYSDFCRIENIDINTISGKAPSLQFVQCNNMSGANISITNHNPLGAELDVETDMQAAIRFDSSFASHFSNILVESAPVAVNIYLSYGLIIDTLEHLNIDSVANAGLVASVGSVTLDVHNSANIEVAAMRHKFVESAVSQDNVILHEGEGVALATAALIPFDWTSDKRIRATNGFAASFDGLGSYVEWLRPDGPAGAEKFQLISGQAATDPALVLLISSTDGTSSTEVINASKNKGGAQTGYNFTVSDVYALDSVNTLDAFYVDGTKVVGNQGAAVADATGGATVDAEARAALNSLLAKLRTHGLIAT